MNRHDGTVKKQFASYQITQHNISLNVLLFTFKSVSTLMYDVCNNVAPNNILDLFTSLKNVHTYNTRSSLTDNFYVKYSKLNQQKYSFSRIGVSSGIASRLNWGNCGRKILKLGYTNYYCRFWRMRMRMLIRSPWLK